MYSTDSFPTTCVRSLNLALLLAVLSGCGDSTLPTPAESTLTAAESKIPLGKLPEGILPRAYRIALNIDPTQERFSGRAEIDLVVRHRSEGFYLHGSNLSVSRIWLKDDQGTREVSPENYKQLTDDGIAYLALPQALEPGPVTLGFAYDAPFADDLAGVYKVTSGGETYIFTQFESIDARRAFPGFDEPRFKTPYTLSITTPKANRVAANTPVVSEAPSEDGASRRVEFHTTQPLPTYLVAFVVGPFDLVEHAAIPPSPQRDSAIPLRGIAVKGKGALLNYALQQTGPLVLEFERYFGVAYPFAKLDLVAVPDFAAGAMENAGLITFRDNLVLLAPDAPASQRRRSVSVNAHEIAHQWFGDLVTMPWWDDIWLNESFATWAGNRAAQVVHPEFSFDRGLQAGALAVMNADNRKSVRRVHEPVNNSDDIANAFDGITYQKGGAVLRMFEGFLGEETFRKGIHAHLEKYAFGSATAEDFFRSMASVGDDPRIRDGFESFVDQKGVPLVTVTLRCAGEKGRQVASLETDQSRYLPLGSEASADQVWTLPFCYRTGSGDHQNSGCALLQQEHDIVALESCPEWVMPNRDGAGYYRWALNPDAQVRLGEAFDGLNAGEQLSIADSIDAAFDAGRIQVNDFMENVPILAHSDIRQVVTSPIGTWRWMHQRLSPPAQQNSARQMRRIYAERLAGLESRSARSPDQDILRTQLSRLLARYGNDAEVQRVLLQEGLRFLELGQEQPTIDWDRLQLALTLTIESSPKTPQEVLEVLRNRLTQSDSSIVRNAILGAIAGARTETSLAAAQALFFSDQLKSNERPNVFFGMLTPEHRDAVWQWFQQNFDAILDTFSVNDQSFLPYVGGGFCSEQKALELERFFRPRVAELLGAERNLDNVLEDIRICEARADRHMADAEAYFREN